MPKNALRIIRSSMHKACQYSKTPNNSNSVLLLAVSKRQSAESVRTIYEEGLRDFGENYLNEALDKQAQLINLDIVWHFVGHIQSNKTRKIAENFAWVHAVDSFKIAKRLSEQRPTELSPLNICLQINIDEEQSKSGLLPNKDELLKVATEINDLPNIILRGLMCIPAPKDSQDAERETFTRMAEVQSYLNDNNNNLSLDTLSMGMSGDLDTAIECGATIVRVGTAIFGARD